VRSATYLEEEGVAYEVRDVSAADLAGLGSEGSTATDENAEAASVATGRNVSENTDDDRANGDGEWSGAVDEVFVNVGRDDGATTADVQKELLAAGISAGDTAYVRVRQRHTFVGVRQGLLESTVVALNGRQIANRSIEAQPARPRQQRPLRRAQEI
jgi:hypothetical protein